MSRIRRMCRLLVDCDMNTPTRRAMELGIEPNTADLRTLISLVGGGEKGVVQVSHYFCDSVSQLPETAVLSISHVFNVALSNCVFGKFTRNCDFVTFMCIASSLTSLLPSLSLPSSLVSFPLFPSPPPPTYPVWRQYHSHSLLLAGPGQSSRNRCGKPV